MDTWSPTSPSSSTSPANHFRLEVPVKFNSIPKLKCLLFAEFDSKVGPIIVYQVPEPIFDKTRFDTFSNAVITKRELYNRLLKVNLTDYKVMGYPVGLEAAKYARNAYIFNLCFVVANESHLDCVYEPLVQKCARYLVQLEQEREFLHNPESKRTVLPQLMTHIFDHLNNEGQCTISVTEQTTIHLKLSPQSHDIGRYLLTADCHPWTVPIFIRLPPPVSPADLPKLDVLTQKLCPYIDGLLSILEISNLVDIDSGLVGRCVSNLRYYGYVSLVPLFLYSDSYATTDQLHQFYNDKVEMQDCIDFVQLVDDDIQAGGSTSLTLSSGDHSSFVAEQQQPVPRPADIFRLYASLKPGITMREWCDRMNPRALNIDERKLVQFGFARGFVKKLVIYPVYCQSSPTPSTARCGGIRQEAKSVLDAYCDGSRSLEEICVLLPFHSPAELYERMCLTDKYFFVKK